MGFGLGLNLNLGLRSVVGIAATTAWTPADLPNLYMWFDASDASTITLNGSNVTQINDKSGNNYHATQSTVSRTPEWGTATINSLNVLDFNGSSSKYMVTGGVAALDRSMAILAQYQSTNNLKIATGARDSGNERSYIGQDSQRSRFAAGDLSSANGNTLLNNTTNVQVGYHNTALNLRHYLNGTQDINTTFTGPIGSVQNYYLGGLNDAGSINLSASFKSWLAEVVFTSDAISDSNREKLEGYLAHKWGTEGLLPVSHPYKSAAPTKSATTAWTPSNLDTNLKLWLDAEDTSTITLNGSTVSQWGDKSGNNRHATQATASNQPTYTTSGLNGKNVLTFSNSSGTYLSIPSGVSDYFPYQSAFIVYSDTSTAIYVTPLGGKYGGSGIGGPYHGHQFNNQLFDATHTSPETRNGDNFKNGTDIGDGTSTARPSTPAIFSYIPTGQFDVNRRFQVIGADASTPTGRVITGLIAEVIILENAASTADRQKMEGYLAWKWGGL